MAKKLKNKKNNKKTFYFRIFAILLPLFLIIIAEIVLRLFSYGIDLHLFIDHRVENYEDYYMVNPYVGEKYFERFDPMKSTIDIFLKQKPENGFRVFMMGSSTIYGFPYNKNLIASRILQKRLQDAYPDKNIEVVNTAITAINSITLRDYINQILDHEPDAILFYAGHNEFYGAFGIGSNETMSKSPFLRTLHFNLMNLRIYQFMRSSISSVSKQIANDSDSAVTEGTLMKRIVKDPNIVYKSANYNAGIQQFQSNLSFILEEAKDEGIPLFLSDLVSNIKDLPPFGDVAEKNLSAAAKYREALSTLSNGDTLLAKKLFYEAKDLDPVRFRAPEEMNQIIYSLAEQNGSILVPTKEWFSNASNGGIIGNNLLTEHVHPNIDGQFVLADAFYTKIVESNLVGASPNPYTTRNKDYYRRNWGYSALDSLIGVYSVNQLKSHWPFAQLESKSYFRNTFKPSGVVETLAFSMISKPDTEIETLHNILGGYYKVNKQLDLALKEYEALIGINPYLPAYYNNAANFLFELEDLNAAEKYLRESLKYLKSYFAFTKIGDIEFIKHDYDNAINAYKSALELADEGNIDIEQRSILLRKLYQASQLNNDLDNMKNVTDELARTGRKIDVPIESHEFEYSNYIPYTIKENFNKALSHYDTNIDSTLYYLSVCLKTNDCPLVNMAMGDVLSRKQDISSIFFYRKAYDVYKKDPNFLAKLCASYIGNEDKPNAAAILEELIDLDPLFIQIPVLKTAVNK